MPPTNSPPRSRSEEESLADQLISYVVERGGVLEPSRATKFIANFKKQYDRLPEEEELQQAAGEYLQIEAGKGEEVAPSVETKEMKEKPPKEAKEKAVKPAKEKIAKPAKEKPPKEVKEKVANAPKEKIAKPAKEKPPKEVKGKAPKAPKEKIAKPAKEKPPKEVKEKAANAPKEKIAKPAKEKPSKEVNAQPPLLPLEEIPSSMDNENPLTCKSINQKLEISPELSKNTYFLGETVKATFLVSNASLEDPLPPFSYRVYYVANNGRNYLVKMGTLSLRDLTKITAKFTPGRALLPTDIFKVGLVCEQGGEVIGECVTEPAALANKSVENLIRVAQVTNIPSKIALHEEIVPIFQVKTTDVVRQTPLEINLTLEDPVATIFMESSSVVDVGGSTLNYIPQSITCKEIPEVNNILLHARITLASGILLFEKKYKLAFVRQEGDLEFSQFGPHQAEIMAGDDVPIFCSINNPSSFPYNGTITLWLYPQRQPPFKAYFRKLQLLSSDRHEFVEKVQAPLVVLDDIVRVLGEVELSAKGKGAKLHQFLLAEVACRVGAPDHPPLEITLRTPNVDLQAVPREILPLQVEVRKNLEFGPLRCEVLEVEENIRTKIIAKGTVKKTQSLQVFNFHWTAPSKIGARVLEVRVSESGRVINPKLIQFAPVSFDIIKS